MERKGGGEGVSVDGRASVFPYRGHVVLASSSRGAKWAGRQGSNRDWRASTPYPAATGLLGKDRRKGEKLTLVLANADHEELG